MNTIGAICVVSAAAVLGGQQESSQEVKAVVTPLQEVEVPAREQGVLRELDVEEGDTAERGERLARIDDTDSKLELTRAEIELQRAHENAQNTVKIRLGEKSLELAELELRRALESRQRFPKSVSDTEISQYQLEVDKAKLELEQAQREYDIAQHNLSYAKNELDIAKRQVERRQILAPLSGIVVQVNHREGEWVEPGETLVRILRTDRVRVEGFAQVRQLNALSPGRAIAFRADLGGQEVVFAGRLRFVSPEVDPVDERVRVWADVENPDGRLRPGTQGVLRVDMNSP